MMKKIFLLFSLVILMIHSCKKDVESIDNYVVLVSFDGFRWDYPDLYATPTFDEMAEQGVKSERIISSFPTKTFPNHYSMATGLYPDHHGIISNSFYAKDIDKLYRLSDREMVSNADFYGGEPIWNTAEKQGVKSASLFWVGSEAPIQGMHPSYYKEYNGNMPYNDRIDTVISWLQLPLEKRPRLVLLYFEEPDAVGHSYGPEHTETGKVIEGLDETLSVLRNKIAGLPYGDKVNLIVTSDHGMGATSPDRYVNLNDYVEASWLDGMGFVGGNPMYLLDVHNEYEDSVIFRLENAIGVTAWKKDEVPAVLNYGSNERISDIVIVADSSWSIGLREDPSGYAGGAHGYDNRNLDMHNIFYAEGPAFKRGLAFGVFENVDFYPLIAEILGLDPAETDGKLEDVEGMLK